jgi:hypothetical protein
VLSGGANATKVTALSAASTDNTSRTFNLGIVRSGTFYLITTVTVPASAGFDGTTPSVDMLNATLMPSLPVDNDGQKYLFLQSTDSLQVQLTTGAVNGGKTVSFIAFAGNL